MNRSCFAVFAAVFCLSSTSALAGAPCKLKKAVRVQVKKDGAVTYVNAPAGTQLDVGLRDKTWAAVFSSTVSGRVSSAVLESACDPALPPLDEKPPEKEPPPPKKEPRKKEPTKKPPPAVPPIKVPVVPPAPPVVPPPPLPTVGGLVVPEPPRDTPPPPPPPPAPPTTTTPAPAAPAPAAPTVAPIIEMTRVVIFDVAPGALTPRAHKLLNASIVEELQKVERISPAGVSVVDNSCDDACLAERGAILHAEAVLALRVVRANAAAVSVELVRLAPTTRLVTARVQTTVADGEVLGLVGPAVEHLFPEHPVRPGQARGVTAEQNARMNPPPLQPWVFLTTAGVAGGAVVVGGVASALNAAATGEAAALVEEGKTTPVEGALLNEKIGAVRTTFAAAAASFGVAAVVGAGAAVAFVFTDWVGEGEDADADAAGAVAK